MKSLQTALFPVLMGGLLTIVGCPQMGCASTMPKDFQEVLGGVEKVASIAQRQGLAYTMTVRWGGKPAIGYTQKVFLNTDVYVELVFHGNAAAERAAVGNDPERVSDGE